MSEYQEELGRAVWALSNSIHASDGNPNNVGVGGRAQLRRMDIEEPHPVFWRLLSEHVRSPLLRLRLGVTEAEMERRWAHLMRCMAHIPHDKDVTPGEAMRDVGYASPARPERLNRLLDAEGELLEDLVIRACHMLASKNQKLDWRRLAPFLLHRDSASRNALAKDCFDAKVERKG